jgi:hypothetical protein
LVKEKKLKRTPLLGEDLILAVKRALLNRFHNSWLVLKMKAGFHQIDPGRGLPTTGSPLPRAAPTHG